MQRSMHVCASAGRWICPDEGSRWNVRERLARVPRGGMLADAASSRGRRMQRSMHVSASAGRWTCPDQAQDEMCEGDWLDLP